MDTSEARWRKKLLCGCVFSWHAHGVYDFFDPCVAGAKWQDPECTVAHAREKFTFARNGLWPSQIAHSMHGHEKYRVDVCNTCGREEDACDSREVCNTSRRRRRLSTHLVLQTSHTRLESPSFRTCYTISYFCIIDPRREIQTKNKNFSRGGKQRWPKNYDRSNGSRAER